MSASKRIQYARIGTVCDIDIFNRSGANRDDGVAIQFANTGIDGGKVVTVEIPWYQVRELREKLAKFADERAQTMEEYAKMVRRDAGCA